MVMKNSSNLILLIIILGITGIARGQASLSYPDQLKLIQKCLGIWNADHGIDTVETWNWQPYGKACIITVTQSTKDKKIPLYTNTLKYKASDGKFHGFAIWPAGSRTAWIASFVSEVKFSGILSTNFEPENKYRKFEIVFEDPDTFTYREYNPDGVVLQDLKFRKGRQ
jgi:hypothetical protein